MEPHYFIATNVIIERDGKILLSRRKNKSWGNGLLCVPGGHVEQGEMPIQAAIREAKEELGLDVKPVDLSFLCVEVKHVSNRRYMSVEFILKTDQEPQNAEPNECSELIWVDPKDLPDDVILNFRNIIQKAYLGKQTYIEFSS